MTPERKAEYHKTIEMLRRCAGNTEPDDDERVAMVRAVRRAMELKKWQDYVAKTLALVNWK